MVKPDMALPCLETPSQINIDKRSTEEINTDSVNTHSFFSDEIRPSVLAALEAKRKEASVRDMDEYREIIKENIDYDILLSDMPYDHDRLEEILELIVETVCSTKKYIRVAGTDYPAEVVRSRLLKLDAGHIQFVFDCLKRTQQKCLLRLFCTQAGQKLFAPPYERYFFGRNRARQLEAAYQRGR